MHEKSDLAEAAPANLDDATSADAAWAEPLENSVLDVEPDSYFGEESSTLGDRVAAARQAAGLTQAGLAARMGVGAKVVSAWENDRTDPRANRLAMLAGLLNVSVSWLLTGGGEGISPPEAAAPPRQGPSALEMSVLVADLDAARRFFGDVLGCPFAAPGADASASVAFSFFGHRLIAALTTPDDAPRALSLQVELSWAEWEALTERLRASCVDFLEEPEIARVGAPEERAALRLADPDGNAFGFVARRHPEAAAPPLEGAA